MGATIVFCLAVAVAIAATLGLIGALAREFATGRTEATAFSVSIAAASVCPLIALSVAGLVRIASLL